MIVIIYTKYKKNPSKTVDAIERTRFSKSRPNDLEDIGQGQRPSHATHLPMLVIICTKYGKNPSRTVDATERTRFSRPRPNDLEDIVSRVGGLGNKGSCCPGRILSLSAFVTMCVTHQRQSGGTTSSNT